MPAPLLKYKLILPDEPWHLIFDLVVSKCQTVTDFGSESVSHSIILD